MFKETLEKVAVLITTFCGFLAAFAWNDVIQAYLTPYFRILPVLPAMVWYAFLITLIAILLTLTMGLIVRKAKRRDL